MLWLSECTNFLNPELLELLMRYRQYHAIIGRFLRLIYRNDSIFMLSLLYIYPRIIDIYLDIVFSKLFNDVHHLGIPYIWAVFFEGKAHNQNTGTIYMDTALDHCFHQL